MGVPDQSGFQGECEASHNTEIEDHAHCKAHALCAALSATYSDAKGRTDSSYDN